MLAMSSLSHGHVLVAGNEDAFRSLAKNFVPQKLAEKLVSLVSQVKVPEATAVEAVDYSAPKIEYDNQNYEIGDKEEYDAADQPTFKMHPQENPVARQSEVHKPKMEVNLDELVEKVRARLLDELKTSTIGLENKDNTRSVSKRRPPDQSIDQGNEDYAAAVENSQPLTKNRSPSQNNKRPKRVSLRQPLRSTRKDKPGVVIESHDLYEKVKLSKKKNIKKDSYEDYLKKVPTGKGDVFEDVEEEDPYQTKPNERPNGRSSHKTRLTTRSNNMNKKLTKITRPTQKLFSNNDKGVDGTLNKLRTTDRSTTKVDYVDDDDHTTATNTDIEPKAATEFMGGWNDDTPKGFETTTEEVVMWPRKKTPKRIQTNMPIREKFTIYTPNYYDKLPRIAEKYNFDEPLPEKDREEENLKPMFKPPHNINGKVKV